MAIKIHFQSLISLRPAALTGHALMVQDGNPQRGFMRIRSKEKATQVCMALISSVGGGFKSDSAIYADTVTL
jgi:hypothetical protein